MGRWTWLQTIHWSKEGLLVVDSCFTGELLTLTALPPSNYPGGVVQEFFVVKIGRGILNMCPEPHGHPFISGCFNWMMNQFFT